MTAQPNPSGETPPKRGAKAAQQHVEGRDPSLRVLPPQNGATPPQPAPDPVAEATDGEWRSLTSPEQCGLYLAKVRKQLADITGDPQLRPTADTARLGGPALSLCLRASPAGRMVELVRRSPQLALLGVLLVLVVAIGLPLLAWRARRAALMPEPTAEEVPEPRPATGRQPADEGRPPAPQPVPPRRSNREPPQGLVVREAPGAGRRIGQKAAWG